MAEQVHPGVDHGGVIDLAALAAVGQFDPARLPGFSPLSPTVASRCDRVVKLRDGRIVDDLALPATDRADATLQRIEGLAPGA